MLQRFQRAIGVATSGDDEPQRTQGIPHLEVAEQRKAQAVRPAIDANIQVLAGTIGPQTGDRQVRRLAAIADDLLAAAAAGRRDLWIFVGIGV